MRFYIAGSLVEEKMKIYLIGSLRNPDIILVARDLRAAGLEVFDEWYAPGPETDQCWQQYEQARGNSYVAALNGWHADHVFNFDKHHLDRCDAAVMVTPCGKSGHMELGYMIGKGKPGWVLMPEEPERWDIMLRFASGVYRTTSDLLRAIKAYVPNGT